MHMRGALVPSIQKTFDVSPSLLGLIAPAGTIGFSLTSITLGMLAGKIKMKQFFLISLGFNSLALALMGIANSYYLFLIFLVGQGLAAGVFRGLDRTILSHMFPDRRGWIISIQGVVWAAGGAIGPLFVALITYFGDWQWTYRIAAFALIPIFFLVLRIELPPSSEAEEAISRSRLKKILKEPATLTMISALVLTGGVEGSFFTWLPYYMGQSLPASVANVSLSIFLTAYIPGRYVFGRLSERYDYLKLVLVNGIIASGFIFLTFFLDLGYFQLGTVFAVGFLVSGMFPLLMSMGADLFPTNSGPINAIAMGSGTLGVSLWPSLIGVLADIYSIESAMKVLLPFMLAVTSIVFIVRRNMKG